MNDMLPKLVLRGASRQSGILDLHYVLSGPVDAELFVPLDVAVRSIEAASAAGAFCDLDADDTLGRLCLVKPAEQQAKSIVQSLHCHGLDPRVLLCLSQMALRLCARRLRLERIEVIDRSAARAPSVLITWPNEQNEEKAYPQASNALLSLLSFEDAGYAKSRRFLIETDCSLSAEDILGYEAWIKPWKDMLERSAFAMPIGSPDAIESVCGSVSQFDDTTVEVHVEVFAASEQAWIALGHMTLVYWRARARITRLLVE